LDASGAPMAGFSAPTFTSSDTANLWVTPTGQLQARGAATGITVIASLAASDNIRHADTAMVNVNVTTDPPPVLASLSIHPIPPDSAVRIFGITLSPDEFAVRRTPFSASALDWVLSAIIKDAEGNDMSGLSVEYRSLDEIVANPLVHWDGYVFVRRPGSVRMVARATAYGVTLADTVTFTVTWPIVQTVNVGRHGPVVDPDEVRLAPYGVVVWLNHLPDSVDVTFDDPTNVALPPAVVCDRLTLLVGAFGTGEHCGTGSFLMRGIAPRDSVFSGEYWTTQVRQFPVPGVYRYHSERAGFTGRVIVTTDPDPAALP